MAYRSPVVGHFDPMRDVSGSVVTPTPAADAAYPTVRLYDDLGGLLFRFASAAADAEVRLDRTAGDTTPLDWLFIPPGHNLGSSPSQTALWEHSDDAAVWTTVASFDPSTIGSTSPLSLVAGSASTKVILVGVFS